MTKSFLEYEEYEYTDLLHALVDKENLEEAIKDCRNFISSKTQLLFTNNNTFLMTVEYAIESEENTGEISKGE